ncbi:hypothetical protein [Leeuwenhoekiella sp. NPDC079379]|uniref:hypothetical protein n=1 Tax=Leeuwenhoekiella sp. NPDC079379 TaxID=3364122 RepID=UPI0037CAA9E5
MVNILMQDYDILLDVQKGNQEGLTFRIFEALALKKKLIITNKSIVDYYFYDPQNLCSRY